MNTPDESTPATVADELARLREQLENQACIIRSSSMPATERECLMLKELSDLRAQLAARQQPGAGK